MKKIKNNYVETDERDYTSLGENIKPGGDIKQIKNTYSENDDMDYTSLGKRVNSGKTRDNWAPAANPPNMGPAIAKDDKFNIKYGNYDFDPNTDYMALINEAKSKGDYNLAAYYENMRNAKIASGFGGKYQPTYDFNYKSQYADKIADLRKQYENYEEFDYDIEKDDNYKELANVYHKNAMEAQKNALAQAAAANGGRVGSNALIAAQLGYGNKMSELEGEIPQLRQLAYNMYLNDKADLRQSMNDYISAEATDYARWNDDYSRRYNITRDRLADAKDDRNFEYGKSIDDRNYDYQLNRDAVGDYWREKTYGDDKRAQALSESQAIGYYTPEAADYFGVEVGAPTLDTKNNDNAVAIALMQSMGYIPDEYAKRFGLSSGGDTLDRIQLNYQMNKKGYNTPKSNIDYKVSGNDGTKPKPQKNDASFSADNTPESTDVNAVAKEFKSKGISGYNQAISELASRGVSVDDALKILDKLNLQPGR